MTKSPNFRKWIPLPKLLPIQTFPQRLFFKWVLIFKNLVHLFGYHFGYFGAKIVGTTLNGNTMLKLNKNYLLGIKGDILEIPRDKIIFESVRKFGCWELEESKFLAQGLRSIATKRRTAFIDIGANTGLVTLQTMNIADTKTEIFIFEPIYRHVLAIKNNLKRLSAYTIHINEFALSDKNGTSNAYTEISNQGNTSLLKSVVPKSGMILNDVKLVDTHDYFSKFLSGFEGLVIKCDTQGMDALILSRIPRSIWKLVECAIIEVWALAEISELDVVELLEILEDFEYLSWSPNSIKSLDINEIHEFWLSKSTKSKELFVRRRS